MTDQSPAYAQALDQLRAERDAAVARADAAEKQWAAIANTPDGGWHGAYELAAAKLAEVTAERDHMRSVVPDLEMQTGPAAHERNQLRDEDLRLREEVAALAAELDGTRSRLTMTTRDLDQSERAVTALLAIIRASVEAIARGMK